MVCCRQLVQKLSDWRCIKQHLAPTQKLVRLKSSCCWMAAYMPLLSAPQLRLVSVCVPCAVPLYLYPWLYLSLCAWCLYLDAQPKAFSGTSVSGDLDARQTLAKSKTAKVQPDGTGTGTDPGPKAVEPVSSLSTCVCFCTGSRLITANGQCRGCCTGCSRSWHCSGCSWSLLSCWCK